MKAIAWFGVGLLVCFAEPAASAEADEVKGLIAAIREAGPQGTGAGEARRARDTLARQGPQVLPELLRGMNTDNAVAANWLRSAFDEIAARALASDPASLPADELRQFLLAPSHQGRPRRLALEVLAQLDRSAPRRLIAPLLDDPEFRYDAVAMAIEDGDAALKGHKTEDALAAYTKAFSAARDETEVQTLATKLRALGREVSIVEHFGLLVDWYLIGPFDGPNFTAFSTVYPPEQKVDLKATYKGKTSEITWKRHRTTDDFGTVNLSAALGAVDDAAAYAYTTVEAPAALRLQLRGGADDNFTIWLNGEKVFSKQEWQNGTRFDRFVVPVTLRKGTNELLVKTCQAPPYRDPELGNLWSMQLRLCDESGKGVNLPALAADPAR